MAGLLGKKRGTIQDADKEGACYSKVLACLSGQGSSRENQNGKSGANNPELAQTRYCTQSKTRKARTKEISNHGVSCNDAAKSMSESNCSKSGYDNEAITSSRIVVAVYQSEDRLHESESNEKRVVQN